jgi:hypothetical protein
MKEHKSNLKALEPVEIRLAAAVRIRHEIARLTQVEQALDADAREIALSVVGREEVVDVVLGVIGAAFADDTEAFDQAAVESFLAEHHDLRIGASAAPALSAPQGALPSPAGASAGAAPPAAGGTPASIAPPAPNAPAAPVVQPAESTSAQQHDAEPSAAEAVAARLSAYEVEMPSDYFGVSFDMLKRPEADLIMGEAILAVVDGLPLDASPYKGDRGKVHWRRKLFEETFAFFLAAPPRAKIIATPSVDAPAVAESGDEAPNAGPPAIDAGVPQVQAPAEVDFRAAADRIPDTIVSPAPQTEAAHEAAADEGDPEAAREAPAPVGDGATEHEAASTQVEDDRDDGDRREDHDAGGDSPADDEVREDAAELPLAEPVREHAGSGQVIDFPSQTAAPAAPVVPAVAEQDLVDPFESSPPHRQTASLGTAAAVDAIDHAGRADTPTYDGPDWEGPGGEGEDDLERNFADRAGFDRDDDDRYVAPAANPGLDHAAAAALAEAVEVPAAETPGAVRLPAGGVPPRPAIAMPSVRPVPAVPPRPALAAPGPVATGLPPARPALAGGGAGGRLAPRPVAVRPPGM